MIPEAQLPDTLQSRSEGAAAMAWLIAPVFLLTAGWIVFASPPARVPVPPRAVVAPEQILPGARRQPITDPPTVVIGGFAHRCGECHKLFDVPSAPPKGRVQHTHIKLVHGMNDRCFNCHDRKDREKLVRYDGTTLSFAEVPKLCAECHGTLYRDWQRGMHGKTMGSWDAASGKQVRLECNDCHDPHAPAYPKLVPLPAPNTLRMGDQKRHHEEGEAEPHRPLGQWAPRPAESAGEPAIGRPEPTPSDAGGKAEGKP